jgi:HSP20 family protein
MSYKSYNFEDFNEIFDRMFGGNPNKNFYVTSVSKTETQEHKNYEINRTKDGEYLFFEAPGFNKSNLKVEIENGTLMIEGKRTYKLNGEDVTRSISQKFDLGNDYNSDSIEATIEDGLLTIFVPRSKKQEKKKISLL